YYSNIVSIPNPNLSWERTHSWDWGLDIRLFDRVNVVLDYYSRKSNAVISQSIPYLNGKSEMDINGGILYNRGYEVTVSFNPVNKKDFGLNVSINASKNKNKGGETPFEATYSNYLTGISTSVLKKGYPVSGFWSYSFAGLDPENGAPLFNNMDVDKETAKSDPTTVLVYSGSSEPDFTGGLNLGIRYKSVTLSSSFALLLGGYKRLSNPYSKFPNGVRLPEASVNLSRELLKRWQKTGDEKHTDIPALLTGGYTMETPFEGAANIITALYKNSDALVVSSSFLRCRNLSLNWQMSKTLTERLRLSSFNVSASVSNLFVVASKRYHGFDPELTESVMPKSYTLSLSVGF
ncbi:MAG: TonB-dependent receptor, partial [Odoribacter sp.]|nr:TonB-dependent receptor [Odoribacter sp.]